MSDGTADVSRRTFLRSATGATAVAAASGAAAAQENESGGGNESDGGGGGGGPPDFGTWFSNVDNFDGNVVDKTGESEVTIIVGAEGNGGNFAFKPPAVHVDPGTKLIYEWTGEGGAHNAVGEGTDVIDSGEPIAEAGVHYDVTIEEDGIYKYFCEPHKGQGMKGAVVVGTDYPTADTGGGEGGGGGPALPDSAKSLGVATSFVMAATLGMAYFFIKFGGDYEETGAE